VPVSMVTNRVGGSFPTTRDGLSHKKAFSAFSTSPVLCHAKVLQPGDEVSVRHSLGSFKESFLQINRIGKWELGGF